MKTRSLLTTVLSFIFCLLSSQIPQGFSYQAIARDATGALLVNKSIPVRITIQNSLTDGIVIWEEEHSSVITNQFGMISLVVGSGTRRDGVASFSDIDWNVQPLFLKVTVQYPGTTWTEMGTTQIWSVPYSMVAKDVEGPVSRLGIAGTTNLPDEALFEVKNKDGQTVFAVYNEGVRIYVDDGDKGAKGGFAVGGFGLAKGSNEEFLRVTRDSTRVYINESTKAAKGGFAVGGFGMAKAITTPFLSLTSKNYFIGHNAGMSITSGLYNSFIGYEAGKMNKDGNYNIFIGYQSGFNHLGPEEGSTGGHLGAFNCYLGYQTGYSNIYGDNNTLLGYSAGWNNTSNNNTFMGSSSGFSNTTGYSNTFIGTYSGKANSTGSYNVFLGRNSGVNIDVGSWNTFIGQGAGANIQTGEKNVIIGAETMGQNLFAGNGTGSSNIIIGFQAGYSAHNSSSNIFIGNQAGYSETGSDLLYITNKADDTPLIYGNFATDDFRINGDIEHTGTISSLSDIRLKDNIIEIGNPLAKLNSIKGIYYEWNRNETNYLQLPEGRQIGVIAQDVEKVYPELVTTNDKGYKMVDYTKLIPVLLEAIKEQQGQIETLQNQIEEFKTIFSTSGD